MKQKIILLNIIFLFFVATTSYSEFYKYRDENGAIRYTDNLAEVPQDQREGIDAYDAVEDYQRPTPQPAPEETEATEEEQQEDTQPTMSAAERQKMFQELTEERNALDAEYAEIQETKSALNAEKANVKKASQLREYNEKVLELNTRIEAYDQKRAAYEEKVKSFNDAKAE